MAELHAALGDGVRAALGGDPMADLPPYVREAMTELADAWDAMAGLHFSDSDFAHIDRAIGLEKIFTDVQVAEVGVVNALSRWRALFVVKGVDDASRVARRHASG